MAPNIKQQLGRLYEKRLEIRDKRRQEREEQVALGRQLGILHWFGVRRVHRLVSMSNMKYDAITGSGIEIGTRVNIPDELIPADARVEMDAKIASGYFTLGLVPDAEELKVAKGRGLSE